ncbi:serine O-acetyltransferase [Pedobacter suwonensis]|uniref:Serine O-acetyltransferase n=2 Tax=Pedobacter suwonensis TaxID=332999 RepID=A0A1I0U983_9SPHI|nr:serine O-acetyltransferase [Pedobacter suwonensis]
MRFFRILIYTFNFIRFTPHFLIFFLNRKDSILRYERNLWIRTIMHVEEDSFKNFTWLLFNLPEYRSVFYYRIGKISKLFSFLANGRESLYFDTPSSEIGKGLIIQHGFSTIVNAKKIGINVQIWHNVTIGKSESGTSKKPTIGNNVKICANAIVLGDINVGNNVVIGAGSVVTKNVPDNCVIVGNPGYIIKRNGFRVNEKL